MSKVIKRFLSFAHDEGITEDDFSILVLSQKKRSGTEIPSVYSAEEIAKLMDFLSTHADNRKRNRAIVMVIAVFGFRAGDDHKSLPETQDYLWLTGESFDGHIGLPATHLVSYRISLVWIPYLVLRRWQDLGCSNNLFIINLAKLSD